MYASALAVALWGVHATAGAPAQAATPEPNGADRMIMWTGCSGLTTLTDEELDQWKRRGVDGFACMGKQLWGMGGNNDFTGDPDATLSSSRYDLQRALRDSRIVARAATRGMKMYLGVKLVNYYNKATPLREWFDDEGWSTVVLPAVGNLAGGARLLGFAGLAFDQELYPQIGGDQTASWAWNYPGNQRDEQQVRAKARLRGRELMTRIVRAFPGAELTAYDVKLPGAWSEVVQREVNHDEGSHTSRLDIDFWDGISSVEGYGAIRLVDGTFYKSPHFGTWNSALHYHYNNLYSYLSRRLSNWSYASKRLHVSPFSWINSGPSASRFDDARPPSYVAEQLRAFRRWGMGGEFANYAWGGLRSFDYSAYESAMSDGSAPAVVDSQPPALTPGVAATTDGGSGALQGTAGDDLAIRAVRWANDRGGEGVAMLTWQIRSGDHRSGYTGELRWSIPDVPLQPGQNRIAITAEDIKGLTTTATVTMDGAGSAPVPEPPEQGEPAPQEGGESPSGQGGGAPLPVGQPSPRSDQTTRRRASNKRRARLRARRRCLHRARLRRSRAQRRTAIRRCERRYGRARN